jgi:hypothetical protein
MAHEKAYYEAEKKIHKALKSGATELTIRQVFICFEALSVDDKGGNNGTR